jgi:hypothetical protein
VALLPWIDGSQQLSCVPTLTLWVGAVALTTALLGLFGAAVYRLPARVSWHATALRMLTAAALTALPVPLVGNLLAPLACTPSSIAEARLGLWGGMQCW